jgi:hypothetical protein
MGLGYRSIERGTLVATIMSLLLAACGGGDGSDPSTSTLAEMSQTPTPSVNATLDAQIVGRWEGGPTCQVLVRALTHAGLRDFAAEWVGGAVLLTTPENVPPKDPKHPCADAAGPVHYSAAFWEDGTYNAYNPDGQEMDAGEYEIVDRNTILFARLRVGYKIDGDTVVFSFSPPKSCTSGCRKRAAYAISFFYPGMTWERVS